MATIPVPRTWAAAEALTSTRLNTNISDVLTFLSNPPGLEMSQTVGQSFSSSSTPSTGVTFTSEDNDPYGMHSNSVNTSRVTAIYSGIYCAGATTAFVASATGSRGGLWAVNGTALNGSFCWIPANGSGFTATPIAIKSFFLNVGDYVELWAAQTSGGSLNTSVVGTERSHITLFWRSTT